MCIVSDIPTNSHSVVTSERRSISSIAGDVTESTTALARANAPTGRRATAKIVPSCDPCPSVSFA